jgi:hypothetical protein
VTFSAKNRNVHLISPGFNIARRQNIMLSVTFTASRRIGSPTFQSSSMNSGEKLLIGFIMANPAVHPLKSLGVGELFHICIYMARSAI